MTRKGIVNGLFAIGIWLFGYAINDFAVLAIGAFLTIVLFGIQIYLTLPRKIEILDSVVLGEIQSGDVATLFLRTKSPRKLHWIFARIFSNDSEVARADLSYSTPVQSREISIDRTMRGYFENDRIEISMEDPWFIGKKRLQTCSISPYWVYPKPIVVRASHLALRKTQISDGSTTKAGDDIFATVREYAVGDEIRKIHWKSSAKLGKLIVRESVTSAGNEILIFLDTNLASYPAKPGTGVLFDETLFERAVSITAGLVVEAFRTGTPISLYSQSGGLLEFTSSLSSREYMKYLALVKTSKPVAFNETTEFAHHFQALDLSQAILVSYQPSSADLARISVESNRIGHFQFLDASHE